MSTDIDILLSDWTEAERTGDRDRLDGVLAGDFVGIGPVGFVLPRDAWLARLGPDLRYDSLDLDEVSVRRFDGAAVVVARQHAVGEARGHPVPGDTRVSFVVVREDDGPRIAGIQYSLMAPPGAPAGAPQ